VIQTDGSTSLTEVAQNYFLYDAGVGPELQFGGADVTVGEFGAWTPIGAVQTSGGYEVVWSLPGSDQYSIWTTDSSGNFVSQVDGLKGASPALETAESVLGQDLNGDGVIGSSATIASGATLELTAADSVAVDFNGSTGTLILDHSSAFAGQISGLSGSDQIDLKDIAFGTGTTVAYTGTPTGGVLTVSDAQGHTANIALAGDYTDSTFALSSDGSGGTTVIDPPKQALAGSTATFIDEDSAGAQMTAVSTGAQIIGLGGSGNVVTVVPIDGAGNTTLTGGAGADTFVFAPVNPTTTNGIYNAGFGKEVITDFMANPQDPSHDVLQFSSSMFAANTTATGLVNGTAHNVAGGPVTVAQSGANVLITLDPTDSITLNNVALATLKAGAAADIHFV